MELGRVGFKERYVVHLLGMYGVTDDTERKALVELACEANSPGWWHKYGDVLPDWFQVYVGLEEAASLIRLYEVQFVPGLLQTADYARAVVALGQPGASAEEVERRAACGSPGRNCSASRARPGCGQWWMRRLCAAPSEAGR